MEGSNQHQAHARKTRHSQPLTRPLTLSGKRPTDILWSAFSSICQAAMVTFPTRLFSADLSIQTHDSINAAHSRQALRWAF